MSALELPLQLGGSWEHALIMTYGLDVPFFEHTLLPLFSSQCRNKIILVDGEHFLELCARSAKREGQISHLNQSYLASGIFAPHDAHAKIILLTNKEEGRLLVGSGNISWQGYASGGELFTLYEYSRDAPEALPAFLAVREMLGSLVERRYIQGLAEQRITHLWASTPWLLRRPGSGERPVRHNLTASFLEQIKQAIGEDTVEELWALAPFFDEKAAALAAMLDALQPSRTILLLQSGYTSVDRAALQQVLDRIPGRYEIRPLQGKDEPVYVHAKLYLLKSAHRALCVQGSPNLSQVAMLLHDPQGNIEAANFLVGPRDAFDYLLAELPLALGDTQTDLSWLELTYQKEGPSEDDTQRAWQLLGGEWQHNRLWLFLRGSVPTLQEAALLIAGQAFPLQLWNVTLHTLELALPDSARDLLLKPVPVAIRWSDGTTLRETNPVIPCNKGSLDAILQQEEPESERLLHSADLNLDDTTFEELLGVLHDTLVIDQQSIWKPAGRSTWSVQPKDERESRLGYDDIDYEALRGHPKIRQYLERGAGSYRYPETRIHTILNAISASMQGLLRQGGAVTPALAHALVPQSEEPEDEDEPAQEGDEDTSGRRWSVQQRIRKKLAQFIHRYLRGLASPAFQQLVGYEVVTKNYLIFSQILWRLFAKDWLELPTIIESCVQSWRLFWGDQATAGYFYQLSIDEQLDVWQWIRDYCNDALLLAAFYYGAVVVSKERLESLHFSLQDSWRAFLRLSPLPLTTEVVADTQMLLATLLPYAPPTPVAIVNALAQLARFETRDHFLTTLKSSGRFPVGRCSFKEEELWRRALGQKVTVSYLVVASPEALASEQAALALLQEWMQALPLDYYRIITENQHSPLQRTYHIYYDMVDQRGKYWSKDQGGMGPAREITALRLPPRPWYATLRHLQELAAQVEPVRAS